jgi:hypothetical protein
MSGASYLPSSSSFRRLSHSAADRLRRSLCWSSICRAADVSSPYNSSWPTSPSNLAIKASFSTSCTAANLRWRLSVALSMHFSLSRVRGLSRPHYPTCSSFVLTPSRSASRRRNWWRSAASSAFAVAVSRPTSSSSAIKHRCSSIRRSRR